jgi:hypothetical protein
VLYVRVEGGPLYPVNLTRSPVEVYFAAIMADQEVAAWIYLETIISFFFFFFFFFFFSVFYIWRRREPSCVQGKQTTKLPTCFSDLGVSTCGLKCPDGAEYILSLYNSVTT